MILSEAELVAAVTRDRAAGKRIGFVALSFDLLRAGEVRRIQAAAAEADRLVVAVADDEQPHVIETRDRAELVDSLRGVAYVIICPGGRPDEVAALAALIALTFVNRILIVKLGALGDVIHATGGGACGVRFRRRGSTGSSARST